MSKQRFITLQDGTSMGDRIIVFETDASIERLKELEKISNDVYISGCKEEEVPIWCNVLENEGYVFEYVDDHINITPYGSARDWLESEYPNIKEHYRIENQPKI